MKIHTATKFGPIGLNRELGSGDTESKENRMLKADCLF